MTGLQPPNVAAIGAFLQAPFCQGFAELDTLRDMPPGSFGRALATHMDELGVDFSAFDTKAAPGSELDWVDRHAFETHDIWHTLTGWGPGPANDLSPRCEPSLASRRSTGVPSQRSRPSSRLDTRDLHEARAGPTLWGP